MKLRQVGWVNIRAYNFLFVDQNSPTFLRPKWGFYLIHAFPGLICRSVPEIFAIKFESCQKWRRILDVFARSNFWGRASQKLYPCYHQSINQSINRICNAHIGRRIESNLRRGQSLGVWRGALKMTDMKMQDMILTDQFARHLQGMKLQDRKYSVNRDYITLHWSVQFLVVVIFLDTNTQMHCARVRPTIYLEKA